MCKIKCITYFKSIIWSNLKMKYYVMKKEATRKKQVLQPGVQLKLHKFKE